MKILLFLIFMFPIFSIAQTECPEDPSYEFVDEDFFWEEGPMDIYAFGDYAIRNNNGNYDILIDTASIHMNDYAYMPHESRVELFTLKLVEDIAKNNAPLCGTPQAPIEIRVYNVFECTVTAKCSLMVVNDDYNCDIGYSGPTPIVEDPNSNKWVIHESSQSCGTVCCVKIYEVCTTENNTHGERRAIVQNVYSIPYNGTDCTDEGNFIDGTTQQIIPCNSGCQ